MQPLMQAAGFIIFRRMPEIQFLLLQANYAKFHWSPPKGHLNPGESKFNAAIRETKEETGFDISVLKIIEDSKIEMHYTLTKRRRTWPKILTYWLAELLEPSENNVKLSNEHQDFKWLPLQEAKDICGFHDFIEALDKCHAIITKDCK